MGKGFQAANNGRRSLPPEKHSPHGAMHYGTPDSSDRFFSGGQGKLSVSSRLEVRGLQTVTTERADDLLQTIEASISLVSQICVFLRGEKANGLKSF